jgi:hypothetical protein
MTPEGTVTDTKLSWLENTSSPMVFTEEGMVIEGLYASGQKTISLPLHNIPSME